VPVHVAFTPDSRSFITSDPTAHWPSGATWPFALKEKLTALGSNHWGVRYPPDGHWVATGHAPPAKSPSGIGRLLVVTNLECSLRFSACSTSVAAATLWFPACLTTGPGSHQALARGRLDRAAGEPQPLPGAFAVESRPDSALLAAGYEGAEDNVMLFRFPSGSRTPCFPPWNVSLQSTFADGRLLVSAPCPVPPGFGT